MRRVLFVGTRSSRTTTQFVVNDDTRRHESKLPVPAGVRESSASAQVNTQARRLTAAAAKQRPGANELTAGFDGVFIKVLAAADRPAWRAALCPVVLHTKADAQCDKLATDDHHQFITVNVRLNWRHLRQSTYSREIFLRPDSSEGEVPSVFGGTPFPLQHSIGQLSRG